MTRSVEIPDAAVQMVHASIMREMEKYGFLSLADVRAALVAARPYLMPTAGQVRDLMATHRVLWQRSDSMVACACDPADQDRRLPIEWMTYSEFAEHQTAAVLALLSTSGESGE